MTTPPHPVRFVLLFDGRTGSSHVTELLDSHPHIRMEGEILGPLLRRGGTAQDQIERATKLYLSAGESLAAIGFKTKLRDVLDPESFAEILQKNSCRVIHMYRQNEIKGAISSILGGAINRRTGKWNVTSAAQRVPRQEVSLVTLQRLVSRRAAHELLIEQFVTRLGLPTIELSYEDLLTDEQQALRTVLAFLDVPPRSLQSSIVKATSDDLVNVVTNLNELRTAYEGTRFEAMFDEQLVPSWPHPAKGEAPERWGRARGGLSRVRASTRRLSRRVLSRIAPSLGRR